MKCCCDECCKEANPEYVIEAYYYFLMDWYYCQECWDNVRYEGCCKGEHDDKET